MYTSATYHISMIWIATSSTLGGGVVVLVFLYDQLSYVCKYDNNQNGGYIMLLMHRCLRVCQPFLVERTCWIMSAYTTSNCLWLSGCR
ncbi:hypothetical protein AAZX31_18G162400 [Glycine max]